MFDAADENLDGRLDKDEFIKYYRKMEEKITELMGGAYNLTDEELAESHKAHDLD